MDDTNTVVAWFCVLMSIAGIVVVVMYTCQRRVQHERDATIIKYLGVLIWSAGFSWMCLTNNALEKKIAVPLVICGVVLNLNGLKFETVHALRGKQTIPPEN